MVRPGWQIPPPSPRDPTSLAAYLWGKPWSSFDIRFPSGSGMVLQGFWLGPINLDSVGYDDIAAQAEHERLYGHTYIAPALWMSDTADALMAVTDPWTRPESPYYTRSVTVFDGRALVLDHRQHVVVYDPRNYLAVLPMPTQDWLDANTWWPVYPPRIGASDG